MIRQKILYSLIFLLLSYKTHAVDNVQDMGQVVVTHKCFESKGFDKVLRENKEQLRLQMVGNQAKTLFEVYYSENMADWTIIVKTETANKIDVSCVVGGATGGGVLETWMVIEKGLVH